MVMNEDSKIFDCMAMKKITDEKWSKAYEGLTLFIIKNGVTIELGEDEIIKIVKCVGANFKRG